MTRATVEPAKTAICTWFVSDADADATFFPQIGAISNTPELKAIYWRCLACFFASSVAVNTGRRHVFFTNAILPIVDGLAIADAFRRWEVDVIKLPITYRLKRGSVASWGNQFYIFDVIDWIAAHGDAERYLVLDSDCLWMRSADAIEEAIDREGVLTYTLDEDEHAAGEPVNGLSREGMARFLARMGGERLERTPYHGGELFAATRIEIQRIAAVVPRLWAETLAGAEDAPREEAHLLSIVYALNGYAERTANGFIRRIWTTLHHYNARAADRALTIWHVPAAKRFGFRTLYRRLAAATDLSDPVVLGFDAKTYEAAMGVPRPSSKLLVTLLAYKLRERAQWLFRRP